MLGRACKRPKVEIEQKTRNRGKESWKIRNTQDTFTGASAYDEPLQIYRVLPNAPPLALVPELIVTQHIVPMGSKSSNLHRDLSA